MVVNKFSVLLAKDLLKMTKISEETGISRTTLNSIFYRKCKGIQFETLDKLCTYLNCSIEDIFEYVADNE